MNSWRCALYLRLAEIPAYDLQLSILYPLLLLEEAINTLKKLLLSSKITSESEFEVLNSLRNAPHFSPQVYRSVCVSPKTTKPDFD